MNCLLKANLDLLAKKIVRDWDFTIIISGGGETRVGKSVLMLQIASYLTEAVERLHKKNIPFNLKDNIVFNGNELIIKGIWLGHNHPYSTLAFDEAGADLQGRKVMRGTTQVVLDYFRECGQYNLFNILVIPEFFDLPKTIAISRSVFLIDVYYTGEFERGHYKFYSRRQKKKLYLQGKNTLDYNCVAPDFIGTFSDFYTIDRLEYKKAKDEALKKRDLSSAYERKGKLEMKATLRLYGLIEALIRGGFGYTQISRMIEEYSGIKTTNTFIIDVEKLNKRDRQEDKKFQEVVELETSH